MRDIELRLHFGHICHMTVGTEGANDTPPPVPEYGSSISTGGTIPSLPPSPGNVHTTFDVINNQFVVTDASGHPLTSLPPPPQQPSQQKAPPPSTPMPRPAPTIRPDVQPTILPVANDPRLSIYSKDNKYEGEALVQHLEARANPLGQYNLPVRLSDTETEPYGDRAILAASYREHGNLLHVDEDISKGYTITKDEQGYKFAEPRTLDGKPVTEVTHPDGTTEPATIASARELQGLNTTLLTNWMAEAYKTGKTVAEIAYSHGYNYAAAKVPGNTQLAINLLAEPTKTESAERYISSLDLARANDIELEANNAALLKAYNQAIAEGKTVKEAIEVMQNTALASTNHATGFAQDNPYGFTGQVFRSPVGEFSNITALGMTMESDGDNTFVFRNPLDPLGGLLAYHNGKVMSWAEYAPSIGMSTVIKLGGASEFIKELAEKGANVAGFKQPTTDYIFKNGELYLIKFPDGKKYTPEQVMKMYPEAKLPTTQWEAVSDAFGVDKSVERLGRTKETISTLQEESATALQESGGTVRINEKTGKTEQLLGGKWSEIQPTSLPDRGRTVVGGVEGTGIQKVSFRVPGEGILASPPAFGDVLYPTVKVGKGNDFEGLPDELKDKSGMYFDGTVSIEKAGQPTKLYNVSYFIVNQSGDLQDNDPKNIGANLWVKSYVTGKWEKGDYRFDPLTGVATFKCEGPGCAISRDDLQTMVTYIKDRGWTGFNGTLPPVINTASIGESGNATEGIQSIGIVAPIKLTPSSFVSKVKTDNAAAVQIGASWCGPCRIQRGLAPQVVDGFKGDVAYYYLDSESPEYKELLATNPEYELVTDPKTGATSVPQTIFIRNGNKVGQNVIGGMTEQDITYILKTNGIERKEPIPKTSPDSSNGIPTPTPQVEGTVSFVPPKSFDQTKDNILYVGQNKDGMIGIGFVYNGTNYAVEQVKNRQTGQTEWQFCSVGTCHSDQNTNTLSEIIDKIHTDGWSLDAANKQRENQYGKEFPKATNLPFDGYIKEYNMKSVDKPLWALQNKTTAPSKETPTVVTTPVEKEQSPVTVTPPSAPSLVTVPTPTPTLVPIPNKESSTSLPITPPKVVTSPDGYKLPEDAFPSKYMDAFIKSGKEALEKALSVDYVKGGDGGWMEKGESKIDPNTKERIFINGFDSLSPSAQKLYKDKGFDALVSASAEARSRLISEGYGYTDKRTGETVIDVARVVRTGDKQKDADLSLIYTRDSIDSSIKDSKAIVHPVSWYDQLLMGLQEITSPSISERWSTSIAKPEDKVSRVELMNAQTDYLKDRGVITPANADKIKQENWQRVLKEDNTMVGALAWIRNNIPAIKVDTSQWNKAEVKDPVTGDIVKTDGLWYRDSNNVLRPLPSGTYDKIQYDNSGNKIVTLVQRPEGMGQPNFQTTEKTLSDGQVVTERTPIFKTKSEEEVSFGGELSGGKDISTKYFELKDDAVKAAQNVHPALGAILAPISALLDLGLKGIGGITLMMAEKGSESLILTGQAYTKEPGKDRDTKLAQSAAIPLALGTGLVTWFAEIPKKVGENPLYELPYVLTMFKGHALLGAAGGVKVALDPTTVGASVEKIQVDIPRTTASWLSPESVREVINQAMHIITQEDTTSPIRATKGGHDLVFKVPEGEITIRESPLQRVIPRLVIHGSGTAGQIFSDGFKTGELNTGGASGVGGTYYGMQRWAERMFQSAPKNPGDLILLYDKSDIKPLPKEVFDLCAQGKLNEAKSLLKQLNDAGKLEQGIYLPFKWHPGQEKNTIELELWTPDNYPVFSIPDAKIPSWAKVKGEGTAVTYVINEVDYKEPKHTPAQFKDMGYTKVDGKWVDGRGTEWQPVRIKVGDKIPQYWGMTKNAITNGRDFPTRGQMNQAKMLAALTDIRKGMPWNKGERRQLAAEGEPGVSTPFASKLTATKLSLTKEAKEALKHAATTDPTIAKSQIAYSVWDEPTDPVTGDWVNIRMPNKRASGLERTRVEIIAIDDANGKIAVGHSYADNSPKDVMSLPGGGAHIPTSLAGQLKGKQVEKMLPEIISDNYGTSPKSNALQQLKEEFGLIGDPTRTYLLGIYAGKGKVYGEPGHRVYVTHIIGDKTIDPHRFDVGGDKPSPKSALVEVDNYKWLDPKLDKDRLYPATYDQLKALAVKEPQLGVDISRFKVYKGDKNYTTTREGMTINYDMSPLLGKARDAKFAEDVKNGTGITEEGIRAVHPIREELRQTQYISKLAERGGLAPESGSKPLDVRIQEQQVRVTEFYNAMKNIGIVADAKVNTMQQARFYTALIDLATLYIEKGVTSAVDFATKAGIKLNDVTIHAWDAAQGKLGSTKDFDNLPKTVQEGINDIKLREETAPKVEEAKQPLSETEVRDTVNQAIAELLTNYRDKNTTTLSAKQYPRLSNKQIENVIDIVSGKKEHTQVELEGVRKEVASISKQVDKQLKKEPINESYTNELRRQSDQLKMLESSLDMKINQLQSKRGIPEEVRAKTESNIMKEATNVVERYREGEIGYRPEKYEKGKPRITKPETVGAKERVFSTMEGKIRESISGIEKPMAEKSIAENAMGEKYITERATTERSIPERPIGEKPVNERLVAERPVSEKTPIEKPPIEKPVVEKPIGYKPIVPPIPEKPMKGIIIKTKHGDKYLTNEQLQASIAWKQGFVYRLWYPPYHQEDMHVTRNPIPEVPYKEGLRSAYESARILFGGDIPDNIQRKMGVVNISAFRSPDKRMPTLHFDEAYNKPKNKRHNHKDSGSASLGTVRG